jgi:nucleotide-binding universal stress UspA family protein
MYDRLLLSTDGSDNAKLAADRAITLADRLDASLHALCVAEITRDDPELTGLEEKLSEERATSAGVETETTVERGVPRSTITEYAEERGIDLIVIGSTGADDPTEKFLGTVSKFVVNEAPADVFVVRPNERLADAG